MKLPPDIEFHPDIRLLVYRPRGLINEAEINRVIGVIEGIEAVSQQPFNRFSDTAETHEVELNFRLRDSSFSSPAPCLRGPCSG